MLPGFVTQAGADSDVTLAWDASSGATGYRLFVREGEQPYRFDTPCWEGTSKQCTIPSLSDNTTYHFVVRAYDAEGLESGNSNEVRYYNDTNPPQTPEIVSPVDNAENVSLAAELITGPFYDPDPGDQHAASRWQIDRSADDLAVFRLTSDYYLTSLALPPLLLEENTSYAWQVRHRNQYGAGSDPATGRFSTELWAEDRDANGIPDQQEIREPMDLDDNGQTDQSQKNMKCLQAVRGNANVAIDVSGSPSIVALSAVQAVSDTSLDSPYTGSLNLPIGLIAFRVMTAGEGDVADITFHFSRAMPADDHWVAVSMSKGYEDYTHSSSPAADRRSIAIQLQDGGSGDLDGVANGIIVGMGAYGSLKNNSSSLDDSGSSGGGGGGGGGGGCFIDSLKLF